MWKGQAPRGHNGSEIQLHHISGKDPGSLLEINQQIHQKISKQLHFSLQKVSVEIKPKLKHMTVFVKHIGKSVHKIMLEVVRNHHIVNRR